MNGMPWLTQAEASFAQSLEEDKIPHAMMLCGPAGIGKTELAQRMMSAALCLKQQFPSCGQCRSCQLIETGAHPDRFLLTFEPHPKTGEMRKQIIVDQVRKLIGDIQLTTTISTRKGGLIFPAEAMNVNAANALLKTLEEPPGQTFLLMVSHNPARLPATVRSRCQLSSIRMPSTAQATEWLQQTANCSLEQAQLALKAAAGSPLHAQQMLEEGSASQYRELARQLDDLRASDGQVTAMLGPLLEIDPVRLWSWISLLAAEHLKDMDIHNNGASKVATLQSQADRNRVLASTPVRKDLLLQDWLIQWSQLNA